MPGGNGKKPNKNTYWEMAKKFKNEVGSNIKTGQHWLYPERIVKFNTKTLEFLVYNINTGQIITYFLPKWSSSNAPNIVKWSQEAYKYYVNDIK